MKILIIDDHLVVREGLCRLLSPVPDISVQEATSTRDALIAFRKDRPDLVLLDLNLPNSSGLELLKRLILEDKEARILVFSMHAEPIYAVHALKAGARGYVSKSAPVEELLTAVRCVADGGQYIEPEIAFNIVQTRHLGNDPFQELTTRETDIMRLLGEGKDLRTIAEQLGVTYKTIANACTVIKGKLGVQRTADLIRLTFQMRDK
jgi:two-component system, NarL family, invasion response regulator UvrY